MCRREGRQRERGGGGPATRLGPSQPVVESGVTRTTVGRVRVSNDECREARRSVPSNRARAVEFAAFAQRGARAYQRSDQPRRPHPADTRLDRVPRVPHPFASADGSTATIETSPRVADGSSDANDGDGSTPFGRVVHAAERFDPLTCGAVTRTTQHETGVNIRW